MDINLKDDQLFVLESDKRNYNMKYLPFLTLIIKRETQV